MAKEDRASKALEPPKGSPVPSGAMYIGLCTTRAQSANLRWQKAIVFMALNGAVSGWCFQLFSYESGTKLLGIALIAAIMIAINFLFRGLVNRANQWIDYFTVSIEDIELKYGTESGITVFANEQYLAKQAAESLVKGLRFRQGIKTLSEAMLVLWVLVLIFALAGGAYILGKSGL